MIRLQLTHSEEKWGTFMYVKQKNKTAIHSQRMIAMPMWSHNEVEQEYRSAYISAGIEAVQRVWNESQQF